MQEEVMAIPIVDLESATVTLKFELKTLVLRATCALFVYVYRNI